MSATEPRLILKTTPPRLSREVLERPRLSLAALQMSGVESLRIEAPAGFGKTSLLCQWRREWLASGACVGWLSVDENDDSPSRFIQAVAYTMEQATGRPGFARIRRRESTSIEELDRLTEWLAEITTLASECVLIIDDGERLPVSVDRETMTYILSNLPPNLHVIVASRTRPRVRSPEGAGRGKYGLMLSAGSLRFTLAETIATLQARFGERVDADSAQRIHDVTEAWPLGLQLIVSAMGQGMRAQEVIAQLAAKSGDLRRQFMAALLAHLPPETSDFLVRISILERVHADLCTAMTGRADAATVLNELRDTTPLLASYADGDWLRLHGLVRDLLREDFAALPTGQRKAAHAAAAAWLDDAGLYDQGAHHAFEAGRPLWAWEMAEKSLLTMLERGQVARVREWLARSPRPLAGQSPALLLTAGWCCTLNGSPQESVPFANQVLADPHTTDMERLRARILLSGAAVIADDLDLAAELVEWWRPALLAQPDIDRFNAFNQLAWVALHQGNVSEARRILSLPRPAVEQPFVMEAYHAGLWAALHLWEGRMPLAIDALVGISRRADAEVGRRAGLAASLAGLLAFAYCENAELDEAEAVLAGRMDVIEQFAVPISVLTGYLAASRIARERGDHARAHGILEAMVTIGERRHIPRVRFVALNELIRQHSLLGHGEVCEALLARFESALAAAPRMRAGLWGEMLEVHASLSRAWTARARGDWSCVVEAIEVAAPVAYRLNRGREMVEIELLRAQVQQAAGQDPAPIRQAAVALATTLGLERIAHAVALQEEEAVPAPAASHPPVPRVAPTALLTPREQRILGLLAERLSNKQIADRLDLSLNTTKWHIKNVSAKLQAASRDHAVQRARLLGILQTH